MRKEQEDKVKRPSTIDNKQRRSTINTANVDSMLADLNAPPKTFNDACTFPKTNSYLHKEMFVDVKKLMSKGRVIESLTKDERE